MLVYIVSAFGRVTAADDDGSLVGGGWTLLVDE